MKLLAFCLLLGMSAQAQDPCQFVKLYDGALIDEAPHCVLLNQLFIHATALDDITRAEFAQAAQRAADETGPLGDGPNPPWPPAEPVDVPAVQERSGEWKILSNYLSEKDCRRVEGQYMDGGRCAVSDLQQTCADKSRILEHDENSPPKYWCHKVLPYLLITD